MRRHLFLLLHLSFGFLAAVPAHAQTDGFAINRFDPAEHGSDWFGGESLDLRGHGRPALGLTLDWAHKPLVLYDADGEEAALIIEDQLHAHVGGGIVLWERLRLAANLPIALLQQGEGGMLGTTVIESSSDTALGDLRLGADLRLLGSYGDAATLAIGVQVHLPTGDQQAFTGDGKVRIVPRLALAGDVGMFAYSARVGVNYRAQDSGLGNVPTGTELVFVATAGLRVAEKKLLLGPELWGSTVVGKSGAAFERATTPFELVLGGHYKTSGFIFGLGFGPGLTQGLGSPAVRVLASIEWQPEIEEQPQPEVEPEAAPRDSDGDGIVDPKDACPRTKGVPSDDPDKHGCPPDGDGDGIFDDEDACPDVKGVASEIPEKHGCPADRDGDGIVDPKDACPDTPGEENEDPLKNGCPGDRDDDGIVDPDDACPDLAGEPHEDPLKNGCPKARVEKGQIKILERIEFKTNSAEILSESESVLEAVYRILSEHEEITKLSIEGHTDNVGKAAYNLSLSQRRTESVVKWLVKKGIARSRLSAKGYGLTRPLESNDTEEGRDRNRRVEFHIKEIDGKAASAGNDSSIEEE
jgi:outer membrane protein OmpA-like peptidoglycan-associated protein